MMHVISSSYGNDSVALIQWAKEQGMADVTVVFIDTGWSAAGWLDRVARCEDWVRGIGFNVAHIKPLVQFEQLMRDRKGFPNQRFQWCSVHLKGLPFLDWIEERDPHCDALVLIGKRREESAERADTPEFIVSSEYHGGRGVWHPLFMHTEEQRNELIHRAGFEVLPHRSQECAPCVNANRHDFTLLTDYEIDRVKNLEADVGRTMFRPKRHMGAKGIEQVVRWAHSPRGKFDPANDNTPEFRCASGYCGF